MFAEPTQPFVPWPENPYVGPRSFRLREAFFYGRERETSELVDLVTASRIVLLHAPAGAGKTSLIQAALIPGLETTFQVLPVVRVSKRLDPPPDTPPVNPFLLSTVLSLTGDTEHAWEHAQQGLAACLDRLATAHGDAEGKPQLLIFDQFEELLTLEEFDRASKQEFFREVGEVLRRKRRRAEREPQAARPLRWALFSMRDEYVAGMHPYFRLMPDTIGALYRLDILNGEQASEAIREPARRKHVLFTDAAADRLVRNLSATRSDTPQSGNEEAAGRPALKDLYVEPVQLQVVCWRLWERLRELAKTSGSKTLLQGDSLEAHVQEAHIQELADVDNALAGYYAEKVQAAADNWWLAEREIRTWFERHLITRGGKRAIVQEGPEHDVLPDWMVQRLVDSFLVRRDQKGSQKWLELAHDRLIEPIRRNNDDWFLRNLAPVQRQAREWDRRQRPAELLLRGASLTDAQHWAATHGGFLNPTDREFLEASFNTATPAERLRIQLYRKWAYVTSGVSVLLVGLLIWGAMLLESEHEARTELDEAARRQVYLSFVAAQAQRGQAAAQSGQAAAGQALQASDSTRRRHRPLQPGLGISGPQGPTLARGVISAFVRDRTTNQYYLLTLQTALTREGLTKGVEVEKLVGLSVYQPGWGDASETNEKDQIGTVSRWGIVAVPGNPVVGVLVELSRDVRDWNPSVFAFGPVLGTGDVRLGDSVVVVGRYSVLASGTVVASRGTPAVSQGGKMFVDYADAIVVTQPVSRKQQLQVASGAAGFFANGPTAVAIAPLATTVQLEVSRLPMLGFAQPGDVGAPVLNRDRQLVGVVLGVSRGPSGEPLTYVLPIVPLLNALNVDLVTVPPTKPAGAAAVGS